MNRKTLIFAILTLVAATIITHQASAQKRQRGGGQRSGGSSSMKRVSGRSRAGSNMKNSGQMNRNKSLNRSNMKSSGQMNRNKSLNRSNMKNLQSKKSVQKNGDSNLNQLSKNKFNKNKFTKKQNPPKKLTSGLATGKKQHKSSKLMSGTVHKKQLKFAKAKNLTHFKKHLNKHKSLHMKHKSLHMKHKSRHLNHNKVHLATYKKCFAKNYCWPKTYCGPKYYGTKICGPRYAAKPCWNYGYYDRCWTTGYCGNRYWWTYQCAVPCYTSYSTYNPWIVNYNPAPSLTAPSLLAPAIDEPSEPEAAIPMFMALPEEPKPIVAQAGEEITLDVDTQEKPTGMVIVEIGETKMAADIVAWEKDSVTIQLPKILLTEETEATVYVAADAETLLAEITVTITP